VLLSISEISLAYNVIAIEHYNQQPPHSALAMQSPVEFYAQWIVNNKQRPFQI